jgi:UDP-GlcNAc:undecaprenyl-phosphate/decaprenyl-phosphate GlcNAc-1-phosphate transferase
MLPLAFTVAALASFLLTPLVAKIAIALALYDAPGERRVHSQPTPRLGGVAVFPATLLAVWGALAVFGVPEGLYLDGGLAMAALLGGAILFAVGLCDDLFGVNPAAKLAAQVVAALVIVGSGLHVESLVLWPGMEVSLGWFAIPLTVLWLVGVTNAFNLIDGLDGLAAGVSLVALSAIAIIAVTYGHTEVALLCVALIGAVLGFLYFNFSPASIFLGDSGSLFVGFLLGVLALRGTLNADAAVLAVVPVLALAIPIFDTFLAISRRWLRGVPMSSADRGHIHHRLLALGLTHRQAAVRMYVTASILALLGLALALSPPQFLQLVALLAGAALTVLLTFTLRRLDYHEFAEAASVLLSGVGRMRRVIRDQIHAQDLVRLAREVESVTEMNRLLDRYCDGFGLLRMEICNDSDIAYPSGPDGVTPAERAWKLDYPLAARRTTDVDPHVLRIWCDAGAHNRPYGVERIARAVAPALEEWVKTHNLQPLRGLEPRRVHAPAISEPVSVSVPTTAVGASS